MVKIVLKSKPEEKLLVNDWAFKGIAISEDKDVNPKILWADGTEEELLRFWLNEPITKPIEKERKPFQKKEFTR